MQQLASGAALNDGDAGSHNNRAWLEQAVPDHDPGAASGGGRVRVRPHALAEHAPALVGPLPLTTVGDECSSLGELLGPGHHAVAAASIRYGIRLLRAPRQTCYMLWQFCCI